MQTSCRATPYMLGIERFVRPTIDESEKNLHESSLFRIDAAVQTCMEATRTPTPHTYITLHQGMRARAQTRAMNRRGVQNHPLLTCKECSIEWILNSYHNNRLPRTKNSSNHQSGRYKTRRVQFAFRLSRTTTRTNGKNRNCSRARGLNCTKNRGSPIPLLDGFYLDVIDVHFQRRTNALIYSSKSSSQSCCPQIERSCSGLQESQIRHHNELFQNEKELPGRRNTYRDLPPRRRWSAAKLLRTCRIR